MATITSIGTSLTLKFLAEVYMSDSITDREFSEASEKATKKLARIIEREGDGNGERLNPCYIAQLIAEAVTADRLSNYCKANLSYSKDTLNHEQWSIKKEMPAAEAAGQI